MIPLAALFRIAFGLLKQSRELVGFGLLASIAIALLLFAISPQPNFRGKIVGTLLAESSDMHPIPPFHPAVVLILMVNLANRGDPSAAQNYKLVATTPNGEEYIGKDMSIPDSMSGTVGNYKLTLGAADALYTKTIAPIPTGGVVSGILFFIFPKLEKGVIDQVGTNLCLYYEDVTPYTYKACHRLNGVLEPLEMVPGINMKVEPLNGQPTN